MNNKKSFKLLIALLCIVGWFGFISPNQAVFKLTSPVSDQVGLLSENYRIALEEKLLNFEKKYGSQIALVIVPTTGELSIEQFSVELFAQNKLGRKGVDDGVLLLIAHQDRRIRIEVGYGLEATLTDILSYRIIHNILVPHFKQGNFEAGIDKAIAAIMAVIQKEELPPPLRQDWSHSTSDTDTKVFFIFIFLWFLGHILRKAWWLLRLFFWGLSFYVLLLVLNSWFLALIFTLLIYVFSQLRSTGVSRSSWTYSPISWSSHSSSSWEGGGWAGGGGSSGGGGASGSW